jgi:engulfment/cell motility protein 1
MPTCVNNIVEPQILHFQGRYAAILNHRRAKAVRPAHFPLQEKMLSEIWHHARLGQLNDYDQLPPDQREARAGDSERSWDGWRRLGLEVDDQEAGENGDFPFLVEAELFRDVGELGLECLVSTDFNTRAQSAVPSANLAALVRHARG